MPRSKISSSELGSRSWGGRCGKVPAKPFTGTNFVNFYCDFLEPNDSQRLWPGKSRKSVGGHAPLKAKSERSNRIEMQIMQRRQMSSGLGSLDGLPSCRLPPCLLLTLHLTFNDARFVHSGATNCLLWGPEHSSPATTVRGFPPPNRIRCGQSPQSFIFARVCVSLLRCLPIEGLARGLVTASPEG